MSYRTRRVCVSVTLVVAFAWIVSGCSGSGESGAVGTAGRDGRVAIGMEIASGFVTVQNQAGRPLVDLKIAIKPARSAPYTVNIPRIDSGGKQDVSLGNFTEPNGARINLRVVHPQEIVATATDSDGKKYEVTMPWKE